ncbi:MAG: hypothetical protein OXF02_05235 [Simkaniaceae bacterium]|nr:hypothetical protein [Simkaniaceae bacterium]
MCRIPFYRKSLFFFLVLFLFVGMGACRHFLVCQGIKAFLRSHATSGSHITFDYGYGMWMRGGLALYEVDLSACSGGGLSGFRMKAPVVRVCPFFGISPLRFGLRYEMDRPAIDAFSPTLFPESSRIDGWLSGVIEEHSRVTSPALLAPLPLRVGKIGHAIRSALQHKQEIRIRGGRFKCIGSPSIGPLRFFFFFGRSEREESFLRIASGEEGLADAPLTAHIAKRFGGTDCEVKLSGFDLSLLDPSVLQGRLSGELFLSFGEERRVALPFRTACDLVCTDLALRSDKYGASLRASRVEWTCSKLGSSPLSGRGVCPGAEFIYAGKGEAGGGKKVECSGTWEITGSSGFTAGLQGSLTGRGRVYPFRLVREGGGGVKVDIKTQDSDMQCVMDFLPLETGEMRIEGSCRHVALATLETWLPSRWADRLGTYVKGGVMSGAFKGVVRDRGLQKIRVERVRVEDLALEDPEHLLSFSAAGLEGRGECDFLEPNYLDRAGWEVRIEKGTVAHKGGVNHTDVTAVLSMSDRHVHSSLVTGKTGEVPWKMIPEGAYDDLQLKIESLSTPATLFTSFGLRAKSLPDRSDMPCKIICSARVTVDKAFLMADGSVDIAHDLTSPSPVDRLLFCLGRKRKEGVFFGWFKGDGISSETLNIPLQAFFADRSVEGSATVEGDLSRAEFSVRLFSEHLVCHSGSIDFGARVHALFRYEFATKEWEGSLPLQGAVLTVSPLYPVLEECTGLLMLRNRALTFRGSVLCEGTLFEGTASLDPVSPDCVAPVYQNDGEWLLSVETDRLEGSIDAVASLVRRVGFVPDLALPSGGKVSGGKGGIRWKTYVGKRRQCVAWDVDLLCAGGTYPLSPDSGCRLDDVGARIALSSTTRVLRVEGGRATLDTGGDESYAVHIPLCVFDLKDRTWHCDGRLETATHDICRLLLRGRPSDTDGEFVIDIDSGETRIFNTKIAVRECVADSRGRLLRLAFHADPSAKDVHGCFARLFSSGLFPGHCTFDPAPPDCSGSFRIDCAFDRSKKTCLFGVTEEEVDHGATGSGTFALEVETKGRLLRINRCLWNGWDVRARMEKEGEGWRILSYRIGRGDSALEGEGGFLHRGRKSLTLAIKGLDVALADCLPVLPRPVREVLQHRKGKIFSSEGEVRIGFANSLRTRTVFREVEAFLRPSFRMEGRGEISVLAMQPLRLLFSPAEGLTMEGGRFRLSGSSPDDENAECAFERLFLKYEGSTYGVEGGKIVLPPEILLHIGRIGMIPGLSADGNSLVLLGKPVTWDNRIEFTCDFENRAESYSITGKLKKGYYRVCGFPGYVDSCTYRITREQIDVAMRVGYDTRLFDVKGEMAYRGVPEGRFIIGEGGGRGGGTGPPLVVTVGWSDSKGLFVRSVEGMLTGLDFSFHHNPRDSCFEQMALTGKVKVDFSVLADYMPARIRKVFGVAGVGGGYEFGGDLILCKGRFADSFFEGYCKGKGFRMMGSEMNTLLGEMTVRSDRIGLRKLNVSDDAGILSIDEAEIGRRGDGKWGVSIPEAVIHDFRPSLLKEVGRYEQKIKPLHIRSMRFRDLSGTLEELDSFTGVGDLDFTNTFRSYYNILEIPFQLLARLGLDAGLLVPVRGHLEYVLREGKIYLTALRESYSEGKRSRFYLSPSQSSFVGLDGTLNVNVKMKQYVLLRITEPFTLSIEGTVRHMRYSLK